MGSEKGSIRRDRDHFQRKSWKKGLALPLFAPFAAGRGEEWHVGPVASDGQTALRPDKPGGGEEGRRLPFWGSNRAPPGQAGRGRFPSYPAPSGGQTALPPDKPGGGVSLPTLPFWGSNRAPPGQAGRGRSDTISGEPSYVRCFVVAVHRTR